MILSLPARVNILGNPSDGNEGDFATISAAVEIRAYANVEVAEGFVFAQTDANAAPPEMYPLGIIPLPFTGAHDLLKGAVNRLYTFSPEFHQKAKEHGIAIGVRSDVPRQSGLGGSTLFILLALTGLRAVYDLDRRIHNDYILAELAQRVECRDLGITGGFSDRYVPLFGGLVYLDYRGKLHQKEIKDEPLVTCERLDRYIPDLPLVAAMTGVRHDSGNVHGAMRPRYLEEYEMWQKGRGETPPMLRFMTGAYETAWRGKMALLEGDLHTFGRLMNENHRIVDEMMRYCGFEDGAGWANNLFIQVALEHGALGAKLTGAGGGGSVFALTEAGQEERLMQTWRTLAAERGLKEAVTYRLKIAGKGLVVEETSDEKEEREMSKAE
jgi:galactokinase/mevalonate kinase-like predicted kinase